MSTDSTRLDLQRLADHDRARACYLRCFEGAQSLGQLPLQARFLMNLGALAELTGRPDVARDR